MSDYDKVGTVAGRDILRGDGFWAIPDNNPSGVVAYTSKASAERFAKAKSRLMAAYDMVDEASAEIDAIETSRIRGGRRFDDAIRAAHRHRHRSGGQLGNS
jgi:hypothetical protein